MVDVEEYLDGARGLLKLHPKRFKSSVRLQMLHHVIPELQGLREDIEAPMLSLLKFSLFGLGGDDSALENNARWRELGILGQCPNEASAQFPGVSKLLAQRLGDLSEHGAYPAIPPISQT